MAIVRIIEQRVERVKKWEVSIPAVAECECGFRVILGNRSNDCRKCGRWYNLVGVEIEDPNTRPLGSD